MDTGLLTLFVAIFAQISYAVEEVSRTTIKVRIRDIVGSTAIYLDCRLTFENYVSFQETSASEILLLSIDLTTFARQRSRNLPWPE